MSLCASCGAELQPNAVFCSACGAAVVATPADSAAPAPAPAPAPIAAARPAAVAVSDVKAWAMWSHLSALGGLVFPFGNILGPLIIWLVKREEIPEVEVNGKEAMNFQITMSGISIGLWIVSIFLSLFTVFLPKDAGAILAVLIGGVEMLGWLAIVAIWITFVTQASIAAHNGQPYTYRFSLRLIK
jgi:uncharacterized Tic20 family protein